MDRRAQCARGGGRGAGLRACDSSPPMRILGHHVGGVLYAKKIKPLFDNQVVPVQVVT